MNPQISYMYTPEKEKKFHMFTPIGKVHEHYNDIRWKKNLRFNESGQSSAFAQDQTRSLNGPNYSEDKNNVKWQ